MNDQPLRSPSLGLLKALIVATQAVALHPRQARQGKGLRILYYHRISADRDELAVHPESFRHQLDAIAKLGGPIVDLYAWAAKPEATSEGAIALTFDDAYHDFADNAYPLLRERRWPATVFVVAEAALGNLRFPWYPSRHPELLRWDEMRAIEREGLARFEPHSLTHPVLTRVDDETAWREISGSKVAVEDELGREARIFCYPGGHFGPRELAMAERAGYAAAVSCEYGVNLLPLDRYRLRRTIVDRYDRDFVFRARLTGSLDRAPFGRSARGR